MIKAVNESLCKEDFLVYPIVFCYRHFIELALKAILNRMCKLQMIEQDFNKDHYVGSDKGNFKMFLDNCDKIYPGEQFPKDTINTIDKISKLDPDSYRFRYEKDIKDQPNFPNTLKINITQLYKEMKDVYMTLNGVIDQLNGYLKDKDDFAKNS